MKKVEIISNWSYCDGLDGEILRPGDKLLVQWSDGSRSEHLVQIKDRSYTSSDHGHPCEIGVTEAYISVPFKNVESLVRLYGQDILCEKICSAPKPKQPGLIKRRKTK